MAYDTEEQREEYVDRLLKRTHQVIAREAPRGIGKELAKWDAIQPRDAAAMKAIGRFVRGEITKEELDKAVVAVIAAWRDQFNKGRTTPEEAA